jgi:hypothetical protein
MSESIEKMQSGREILLSLEGEGKYVFHGSQNSDIDVMEPRQAYNHKDQIAEKDGDPAVFASKFADYAIFRAIVNENNCPKGVMSTVDTKYNRDTAWLEFEVSKEAMDQLDENSSGYVYVFDKDAFTPKREGAVEYISTSPVSSVRKIKVMKSDLPPDIKVVE